MKIRTGFVSNSSSSNFVINNSYKTVFDLAKAMLNIRSADSETWIDTETSEINKAITEGKDPNSSIYFSTCNYDTFIKKVLGYYIVTTCNNHLFKNELNGIIIPPESIKEWLTENNYISDYDGPLPFTEFIDSWKFQCGEVFWSPRDNLEISRFDYMEAQRKGNKNAKAYCSDKDHFQDMVILASTGKVICPICYKQEKEDEGPEIENRFEILDL